MGNRYRDSRHEGHGGHERNRGPWQWLVLPAFRQIRVTARGTAEAHPERFRVSLFSLPLAGGVPGCGNDEHDPSGFDVPEHLSEPEIRGQHNHGFLFCVIRLIGVHLFRFRFFSGVVRREASPPFRPAGAGEPAARRRLPGVAVWAVVHVHVHGADVAHTRRRACEARARTTGYPPSPSVRPSDGLTARHRPRAT